MSIPSLLSVYGLVQAVIGKGCLLVAPLHKLMLVYLSHPSSHALRFETSSVFTAERNLMLIKRREDPTDMHVFANKDLLWLMTTPNSVGRTTYSVQLSGPYIVM